MLCRELPDNALEVCLMGMTYKSWESMSQEDQSFLINTYRHFQSCTSCKRKYEEIIIASVSEVDDETRNLFSPEAFRLLKQNESVLASLV